MSRSGEKYLQRHKTIVAGLEASVECNDEATGIWIAGRCVAMMRGSLTIRPCGLRTE